MVRLHLSAAARLMADKLVESDASRSQAALGRLPFGLRLSALLRMIRREVYVSCAVRSAADCGFLV